VFKLIVKLNSIHFILFNLKHQSPDNKYSTLPDVECSKLSVQKTIYNTIIIIIIIIKIITYDYYSNNNNTQ